MLHILVLSISAQFVVSHKIWVTGESYRAQVLAM